MREISIFQINYAHLKFRLDNVHKNWFDQLLKQQQMQTYIQTIHANIIGNENVENKTFRYYRKAKVRNKMNGIS